ncbi:MAG: HAD-IC family P-type ATPase, partial [Leptolyngbyaceae cyanobacterium SM2_3_12]|nr:HAD-IC family P-type ATPase [Leptolyngbyaceae cyanobacterium SM2_3_12]
AAAADLPLLPATDFQTEVGLGVTATVTWQGSPQGCSLGNQAWIDQLGLTLPSTVVDQANTLAKQGKTVMYMTLGDTLVGLIAVADVLRPDAAEVVAELQSRGLKVNVLTGDKPEVAQAIASQLHLSADQVKAEVSPQGKVEAVRQLQAQGHTVALVGDGINDAPALAQADVGISLHSGTDIAMETADVILMRDQLSGLLDTLTLSRATFNKIRQNLSWALAYNLVGIPLAAGVLLPTLGFSLSPAAAGGMMAFSSVTVVVNSLLLRWLR